MKVWLADLTYTQQTIASDVMPAAIGMLAEHALHEAPEISDMQLFKYPEDLIAAIERERPDVLGFSNYVWNSSLSLTLAREFKADHPDLTVVFGGPNFPMAPDEQETALRRMPWVDYYVTKEAEHGFVQLIKALLAADMDKSRLDGEVSNLCYIAADGSFRASSRIDRLLNLDEVPSPYLSGRLDAFFDGRLLPVIQTARGCPFTCAFCTEGQFYWNKVRSKPAELIRDEIVYIAQHLARLPAEQRRSDLLIADSNFGMYQQDLETCRVIAGVQDQYDYPKYINVATGKNKKERILEAAKLVRGAMKLAGSVQSLDPVVQENMKRRNISSDQIMEMAMRSSEIGTNTYSEVILALPGDSRDAHFRTLETLVDAGFNTISMYQLMMLVGTEFGTEQCKKTYDMKLKYRAIPRCFGNYRYNGRDLRIAEIEEICVANATLPYDDYLKCRKMNLIVNVFYNDGIFSEVVRFLKLLGISPWSWLEEIYETGHDPEFEELVALFLQETEDELWADKGELEKFIQQDGVVERYIAGELGSNLIFKYKAMSMTRYLPASCRVALQTLRNVLAGTPHVLRMERLAEDIIAYKSMQVDNLFGNETGPCQVEIRWDVPGINSANDIDDLHALEYERPRVLTFLHSDEQRRTIESYVRIFGNDTMGMTRILSRVYLKQLLRQPAGQMQGTAGHPVYITRRSASEISQ